MSALTKIKGQLLLKIGDELVTLGTITIPMSSQVEHKGNGAIVLRSTLAMREVRRGSDGMSHKFKPETTNGGNCFSDCACGWSGGVYQSRKDAMVVWDAHAHGLPELMDHRKVQTIALLGERPRGMEIRDE